MNDVRGIFDKLKEYSYYREFLLQIRNEMAKNTELNSTG